MDQNNIYKNLFSSIMPGMVTCTVNNALTTDQFVDVQNMYTNRRQYS